MPLAGKDSALGAWGGGAAGSEKGQKNHSSLIFFHFLQMVSICTAAFRCLLFCIIVQGANSPSSTLILFFFLFLNFEVIHKTCVSITPHSINMFIKKPHFGPPSNMNCIRVALNTSTFPRIKYIIKIRTTSTSNPLYLL